MKLKQFKMAALKNREQIMTIIETFITKYQRALPMTGQSINNQCYQIAKQELSLEFNTLHHLYEAGKNQFSLQTLRMTKDIYTSCYLLSQQSSYISELTMQKRDLKLYQQFVKISEIITVQNMQQVAQIIRDQLCDLQKRIHRRLSVMQQWLERQNQIGSLYIKAENLHLRVQIKSTLHTSYNLMILRHFTYIQLFSRFEINNECFWLSELRLLAIKLKDLIDKMLAQKRTSESAKISANNSSQNNSQFEKQVQIQVYSIYEHLQEDRRNVKNMIYHLKEQYADWINHQKEIRKKCMGDHKICNWYENICLFEKMLSEYEIQYQKSFIQLKDIKDQSQEIDKFE